MPSKWPSGARGRPPDIHQSIEKLCHYSDTGGNQAALPKMRASAEVWDIAVPGKAQGCDAVLSKCSGCGEDAHLEHTLIIRG